MKISILTIFPEMMKPMLEASILGRAIKNGILDVEIVNIRDFSELKHKNTDDYPFGGGVGMLMLPQPIFDAFASLDTTNAYSIYMSPQGETLSPRLAQELSEKEHLIILCGHYEGVDQRVIDHLIDKEVSIGDYVLTGGELAAAVMTDAIVRIIPGAIGDEQSALSDSFQDNLLAAPVYTRPAEYKGWKVPDILLSGHDAKIKEWELQQSYERTKRLRPDLLKKDSKSK